MKRNLSRAILALVIAALALSCSNFFSSKSRAGVGSLKIQIASTSKAARTVLPPTMNPSDFVYDLSLTGPGSPVSLPGAAYNALSVGGLTTGTWSLSISGYSSGHPTQVAYSKTTTVTINAGANTTSITLDPCQVATGSISVALDWPATTASLPVDEVEVYSSNTPISVTPSDMPGTHLTDAASAITYSSGTGKASTTIGVSGVGSGTIYLYILLYQNLTLPAVIPELVRVYDYQTSTATIDLSSAEISQAPPAPTNLVATLVSAGSVDLQWENSSNVITDVLVYRDSAQIADVTTPGMYDYVDTGAGSSSHTYGVVAHNDFGASAQTTLAWAGTNGASINFSLSNPSLKAVTFANATVDVAKGDSVLLSTSSTDLSTSGSNWKWTVDGGATVATTKSFSLNSSSLSVGDHIVSLSVDYQGNPYSGSLRVTVTQVGVPLYSVTYSNMGADGGDVPIDSNLYAASSSVTVLGNSGGLTKKYWTFGGWTDNPAGTGTVYAPSTANPTYTLGSSDLVLYPKWNPMPGSVMVGFTVSNPSYSGVSFENAGVTPIQLGGYLDLWPDNSVLSTAAATAWVWSVDENVDATQTTSIYIFNSSLYGVGEHIVGVRFMYVGVEHSGFIKVIVNDSAAATYTVTYSNLYADSGQPPSDPNAYAQNSSVTVLGNTGNLARANWTFVGWNTATDTTLGGTETGTGIGTPYSAGATLTMGTANVVLYPQWIPFAGGDGTAGNPYQVSNAFQLNQVRDYFGSGIYFVQTADIDLTDYVPWVPIGDSTMAFTGSYQASSGGVRTITGLHIYSSTNPYMGLFGAATLATIKGIFLANVNVNGGSDVGALLGEGYSVTISDCGSTGTVSGDNDVGGCVGGLVGYFGSGTISECYSSADVDANNTIGGLVGSSSGAISDCYSAGSVTANASSTGGFAGVLNSGSTTTDCYSAGAVSANGYSFYGMGSSPTLVDCVFDFATCATTNYNSDVTSLSDSGMGMSANFPGWSTSIWDFSPGTHPMLYWQ